MKVDQRLRKITHLTALLGMLALGLAEMSLPYLVLIVVAALAAWFLERHPEGRTISPRLLNAAIVLALAYAVVDYLFISRGWILSLAHFLLMVQMAKLLLPKSDRDCAQILLISLMNVAVAAIVTVNVFFAVTFVLYSGTAIWGLILLHFDREVGQARHVYLPGGADTARPASSVNMREVLSSRFLWTVVAVIVVTWVFNGLIFLFSPRVPAGFIHVNPMGFLSRLTGYSDSVTLGEIGRILQNDTPVMHVWMRTSQGKPITGPNQFYWRGSTYQHYDGRQWHRHAPGINPQHVLKHQMLPFERFPRSGLRNLRWIQQEITLEPIGTRTLFTPPGFAAIRCNGLRMIRDDLQDDTIQADRVPNTFTRYTTISAVTRDRELTPRPLRRLHSPHDERRFLTEYLRVPPEISRRVVDLAREIAPAGRYPTALEQARRVEAYLARNYAYTLDLDADPDVEPVEDFLFNRRKGHCEYFASSMVILLRALNIPSRLVSGFHGGQWSDVGEWYVVKQSDAHAWVEAYFGDDGWLRFDPTPSAARTQLAAGGAFGPMDRWIDYVRTTWINYVVQYDREQQSALLERTRRASRGLREAMGSTFSTIGALLKSILHVLTDAKRLTTLEGVLTLAGALGFSTTIVLTMRWLLIKLVRWMREALRRRRVRRLGRAHIAFYQELERTLTKKGFVRSSDTTPREFIDQVAERMHGIRDALEELTDAFYRVRFGEGTLDPAQENRFRSVIESVRVATISPHH